MQTYLGGFAERIEATVEAAELKGGSYEIV